MDSRSTKPTGSMHVADLARKAGVTPAAVRFYTRSGLIHPAREPHNGYRCFSVADLQRLVFIRRSQALGLTIGDIKTILDAVDRGEQPCEQVKSLVERRLVSTQERIDELEAMEARMARAISSWEGVPDLTPGDEELCPLIDRLNVLNVDFSMASRQSRDRSAIKA